MREVSIFALETGDQFVVAFLGYFSAIFVVKSVLLYDLVARARADFDVGAQGGLGLPLKRVEVLCRFLESMSGERKPDGEGIAFAVHFGSPRPSRWRSSPQREEASGRGCGAGGIPD